MRNYILKYRTHFDAAHHLPNHPHCGGIHGHRFEVNVEIKTPDIIDGFVIDFIELSSIIDKLDHPGVELNKFIEYPSCENISHFLYDRIKQKIKQQIYELKVEVQESPGSSIIYYED